MRKITMFEIFVLFVFFTLIPGRSMSQIEPYISKERITSMIHSGLVLKEDKIVYRGGYFDPNLNLYSLKDGTHILFSTLLNKGAYVAFDDSAKAFLKHIIINKDLAESAGDFLSVKELIIKYENEFRTYFKDDRISFYNGDSLLSIYLLEQADKVRRNPKMRLPIFVYIGEKIRHSNNWQWEVDFDLYMGHRAFVKRSDGKIFNPMKLVDGYYLEGVDDIAFLINLYMNVEGGNE